MSFMHSESPVIHVEAERLFRQPGLEGNYGFELKHKAIIDRFGYHEMHESASISPLNYVLERKTTIVRRFQPGLRLLP